MGQGLIGLTVASSVLLLLGLWARAAGLLAVALFLAALLIRPFAEFDGKSVPLANVLNYLNVGGAALFLALMGRGSASLDSLRKKGAPLVGLPRERAVGLLRLSLGAALVILGVQKFLLPELPMGVVQNYADEVYIPLHKLTGISPESYVFAAAMVEASVGLLIMAGVFTRALMVVLIGLFTLTAFIFEGEVLGHLPILGAVLALLIEGGGAFRVDSWFSPRAAAEVDDSPQADQPPRRARLGVLDPA